MIKGIEGILAFALMGMAIGGVIGGRDSVAELFQKVGRLRLCTHSP